MIIIVPVSQIFPRVSMLRTEVNKLISGKTDNYYQLSTSGLARSEVCDRVDKLLTDQHYIFPVVWQNTPATSPANSSATASVSGSGGKRDKTEV